MTYLYTRGAQPFEEQGPLKGLGNRLQATMSEAGGWPLIRLYRAHSTLSTPNSQVLEVYGLVQVTHRCTSLHLWISLKAAQ